MEGWLSRRPGSAEAYYWKARLGLALHRPEGCIAALQQAELLGYDRGRLDELKAISRALAGQAAQAEPLLREAFNRRTEADPLLDEVLAQIYLETYDLIRAEAALARWMVEAPGHARPHLWRAEIDSRRGNPELVIEDYRQALKRDPGLASARLGLAEELRKAHQCDAAVEVIAPYLREHPDDPAGYLTAGRIDLEQGRSASARQRFQQALALDARNVPALREMAELSLREGDNDTALGLLDRAVTLDPFEISTRHSRSIVLARLGKTEEARTEQARASQLRAEQDALLAAQARLVTSPRDLESRLHVTRWMLSHGKASEAVRWAETILRDQPGQPDACRLLARHYEANAQLGLANFYRAQSGSAEGK
jgi:predicted Zn-dependent protease